MIRLPALACAAVLAFTLACGGKSTPAPAPTLDPPGASPVASRAESCATPKPHAAGESTETLQSGGAQRSFIVRLPSAYDGTSRLPVVLLFHGFGMNARVITDIANFGPSADTDGFIVVSPEGTGTPQYWNAIAAPSGPDDVAFVKDLLSRLDAEYCIDADRVFAAGYSNGAAMAERLSCDLPGTIAAVGVVASTYTNCQAHAPVIALHGLADPIVPFEGGVDPADPTGPEYNPVRRSISEWAKSLGCDGLGTIARPLTDIELTTYHNCIEGDGETLLYAVIGGGHTWPGAAIDLPVSDVGVTTHAISATSLMWDFFRAHPLTH